MTKVRARATIKRTAAAAKAAVEVEEDHAAKAIVIIRTIIKTLQQMDKMAVIQMAKKAKIRKLVGEKMLMDRLS